MLRSEPINSNIVRCKGANPRPHVKRAQCGESERKEIKVVGPTSGSTFVVFALLNWWKSGLFFQDEQKWWNNKGGMHHAHRYKHSKIHENRELKNGNCQPTNWWATPRTRGHESRQNTRACASRSGICACELYRWQMWERDSSAVVPKVPKVEKLNGMKSESCDLQVVECLSRLPYSMNKREEAPTALCTWYRNKIHTIVEITERRISPGQVNLQLRPNSKASSRTR